MSVTSLEILCGVIATFLVIYYYLTATYNFWKSRNIPGPEPIPFFGNFKDVILTRISPGQHVKTIYDKFSNHPFIGVFLQREPLLLVTDLNVMKEVLIKDFTTFSERGTRMYEKQEPLSEHIAALETERWRPLRMRLTGTFTSGKLRKMFYLLAECGENFEKYISEVSEKGIVVDVRELTAKFTTDVIGSCVFGLQMKSLESEDSEFRVMGRKLTTIDFTRKVRNIIKSTMPWLYKLLDVSQTDKEISTFFIKSIKDTMDYRKKNGVVRHDFVDLLMDLKDNPGQVNFEITDNLLTSQAFVFFGAGFETSSITMSHALYELAQNQTIQDKLREEIRQTLEKNNGQLSYDVVKEMKYLDKIFKETLRQYPPAQVHMREALKDYTFAGTNLHIPKGTKVVMPVYAIHHDPKHYPNPEVFDPERFTDEACKKRHQMAYTPFGEGPRNCIGSRFATYQSKLGLLKIVQNHKVDVCEKTRIPYVSNPASSLLGPIDGIHLKFYKVE